RGLTVAAMIAVNNPGNWNAVYAPLTHAAWDGCTLADLVFPFFIVIMGIAMPLAFDRRRQRSERARLPKRILTRAALLFALGVLLNVAAIWPDVEHVRIMGVLQRIGLTYAATALIMLQVPPARQAPLAGLLLVAHWALLMLVPFGGTAGGVVSP